jgi:hypothetical protein
MTLLDSEINHEPYWIFAKAIGPCQHKLQTADKKCGIIRQWYVPSSPSVSFNLSILGFHSCVAKNPVLPWCYCMSWNHTDHKTECDSISHPHRLIWRCALRHMTWTNDGKGKGNLSLCMPWRHKGGCRYNSTHSLLLF